MDWTKVYRRERKANWSEIAQAIFDSVTMEDVLDVYAPSLPRRQHRCPCPLHNGKDFNFSYRDHSFHCFVCGESGDVIAFVKAVCELATRQDAMRRINSDFHLMLPIDGNASAAFSAEVSRRRAEAEEKRRKREDWEKRYHEAMDEWTRLDRIATMTPCESDEDIKTICDAKEKRAMVGYLIDLILEEEPR